METCLICAKNFSGENLICKDCETKFGATGIVSEIKSPKVKVRHEQREAQEQEALISWARYNESRYPELKLIFHIPNGGSRNKIEAAHLKQQGVKAGVPDLCLPVARGKHHGLFVEMKYGENKQTDAQKQWERSLKEQRYAYAVCYSWEEAAKTITEYLIQSNSTSKGKE